MGKANKNPCQSNKKIEKPGQKKIKFIKWKIVIVIKQVIFFTGMQR
jgi:hypothetical protein